MLCGWYSSEHVWGDSLVRADPNGCNVGVPVIAHVSRVAGYLTLIPAMWVITFLSMYLGLLVFMARSKIKS